MSENDGINESNDKPYRSPARSYNPNARVTPSQYKATIKALTKAVRKEEKRHEKVSALKKQIEELSGRLSALRNG